jgi:hypothetical protein
VTPSDSGLLGNELMIAMGVSLCGVNLCVGEPRIDAVYDDIEQVGVCCR